MNRFMLLLKRRWYLALSVLVILGVLVVVFLLGSATPQNNLPPVNGNNVPPVVVTTPSLDVVSIEPPAGKRESIDGFTPTIFKFSSSVDVASLRVEVFPTIVLKKVVFPEKPDSILIEPEKTPWQSGVTYTLKIRAGLKGISGEELKQDVEYSFSNTPPEYIDLANPI